MHYRAVLLDLCLPIMDGFEAAAVLRQRARLEPPMRSSALVAPYTGAARIVKLTQYGFPLRISFDEAYGRIVDHLDHRTHSNRIRAHDNAGARSALGITKSWSSSEGKT